MSSKIGTLLSLIFLVSFFLIACDIMSIQYLYSDLDAKSISISYLMSKNTTIDESFIKRIENKYNVKMTYDGAIQPSYGEVVSYKLSKEFDPLVVSNSKMDVTVIRTTVIGYFG